MIFNSASFLLMYSLCFKKLPLQAHAPLVGGGGVMNLIFYKVVY
jgi:hypothetical protein